MKWSRIAAAVLCAMAVCAVFVSSAWATKYVAMGDSYSSGTGTRTYYEASCQRSVYAYPYLLHNAHPTWTFVNATCSGAKTGDVLGTQVNSVTSDTNWVSYTIGGNDAGFSSVITECALPSWASNCDGAINTAQSYIQNTLPGRLDLVNNAIKSRAPSAKVVVLDYPRLFNGTDCNAQRGGEPGGGELRLPRRDPLVHRPRGLRRRRRVVDGVDQRPLEPDRRELPPEGHRPRQRLLPGDPRGNGLSASGHGDAGGDPRHRRRSG